MKMLMKRWDSGAPTPAIDDAPEIEPHLMVVWDAYVTIERSRQWGMGFPQPIQMTEIEAYARMYRITGEELVELIDVVQYLDSKFLERHAQRKKGS